MAYFEQMSGCVVAGVSRPLKKPFIVLSPWHFIPTFSPLSPYQHCFEKEHLAPRDTMVGREGCVCVYVCVCVVGWGGIAGSNWRHQPWSLPRHFRWQKHMLSLSPCRSKKKTMLLFVVGCWLLELNVLVGWLVVCVRICWLVSCLTNPWFQNIAAVERSGTTDIQTWRPLAGWSNSPICPDCSCRFLARKFCRASSSWTLPSFLLADC